MTVGQSLLFFGTSEDKSYLPFLKKVIPAGVKVQVSLNDKPIAAFEPAMVAKKYGITQIFTTSEVILQKVLGWDGKGKTPTINDYAGSLVRRNYFGVDYEYLFIDPLQHMITVPYGEFVLKRYLSKYTKPASWIQFPEFTFEVFDPARTDELLDYFASCTFVAQDIETAEDFEGHGPIITCHSFTAFTLRHGTKQVSARTVVVPYNSLYNITFASALCQLEQPKVFQNGKYDIAYLLRYGHPPINYAFDTINLFHCWLAELPKDLGFITTFLMREAIYWKNLGSDATSDLQYYEYNGRDSFNTGCCLLSLLLELPQYAWTNYSLEFPVVFPCILAEATGIRHDALAATKIKSSFSDSMDARLRKLRTMVSNPAYNPSSSQQTVKLFAILGSGDIKSSGKIPSDKVMARHPLNSKILGDIKKYREDRKRVSSYLKDGVAWHGRVYYALNPHGTDTSRLASRESQFWCGLQIQNIPRDPPTDNEPAIKDIFVADEGFYIGEADRSQAETFDTAFLSGDPELLRTITDRSIDFHGSNASKFFGVPYESIVSSTLASDGINWVHKTLDKALRDLSKRTNHGANYNMGASVLLDTMGIKNVIRAKKLLVLPEKWSLIQVCQYLLNQFAKTYSVVKGDYYGRIKTDIASTGLLVGPTGWTRRCFSDPAKSKHALNSYVAHPSQSLNAQELNIAWRAVFQNVYLPNSKDFKLYAQIHDSILFGYREGREDLAWAVKREMEITTPVTDIYGVTRDLCIPVDLKGNARRWSECTTLRLAA